MYMGIRVVWAGCILILGIYLLYSMTKGCMGWVYGVYMGIRGYGLDVSGVYRDNGCVCWVYIDIYIFGEYLPFSNIFRNILPGCR